MTTPPPWHSPVNGKVVVSAWWDIFTFNDEVIMTCPDCDELSPPLTDIWALVSWTDDHYPRCPAGWGTNGEL